MRGMSFVNADGIAGRKVGLAKRGARNGVYARASLPDYSFAAASAVICALPQVGASAPSPHLRGR